MKRRTLHVKASGQVFLEAVLVAISLATFALASMKLFSNLNLNMTDRIDHYKLTRVNAINNGGDDPLSYLYYYTHTPSTGTGFDPGLELVFLQDPNILEASRLMQKENFIINTILPYKISQAYFLGQGVKYEGWDYDGDGIVDPPYEWHDWDRSNDRPVWNLPARLPQVRRLIYDCQVLANQAYNDFGGAIDNYKKALGFDPPADYAIVSGQPLPAVPINSPVLTKPGPFNPEPTLAIYHLDNTPVNAQRIAEIKAQNLSNRENIKSVIVSLQSAYGSSGGLHTFLYGPTISGNVLGPSTARRPDFINGSVYLFSMVGSLAYVVENFGHLDVKYWWWRGYGYEAIVDPSFHNNAIAVMKAMMDSWINPVSLGPIDYIENRDQAQYLRANFLDSTKTKINSIYNAICVPTINSITQAACISAKADAQVVKADVQTLINSLPGTASGSSALNLLRNLLINADYVINGLTQAIARWDGSPPAAGDKVYTYQGEGTVVGVNLSTHKATIKFSGINVEMNYSILKKEGLRTAQTNIWPLYGQTHDVTAEEQARAAELGIELRISSDAQANLIFDTSLDYGQGVFLSAQIESIRSFFAGISSLTIDAQLPDEFNARLANSTLYSLTYDGKTDVKYSKELAQIHSVLNGLAEDMKNRLDAAVKSWDNEADLKGTLTDAALAEIADSRNAQLALAKMDIWALWRVITDCHYVSGVVVVRNSGIPVPGAPDPY